MGAKAAVLALLALAFGELVLGQEILTIIVCEDDHGDIRCDNFGDDFEIEVLTANFGRTDTETCEEEADGADIDDDHCISDQPETADGASIDDGDCISDQPETLNEVRHECDGEPRCTVFADRDIFGDECNGIFKYLNVTYRCIDPSGEETPMPTTTPQVTTTTAQETTTTTLATTTTTQAVTTTPQVIETDPVTTITRGEPTVDETVTGPDMTTPGPTTNGTEVVMFPTDEANLLNPEAGNEIDPEGSTGSGTGTLVGVSLAVTTVCGICICFGCRKRRKKQEEMHEVMYDKYFNKTTQPSSLQFVFRENTADYDERSKSDESPTSSPPDVVAKFMEDTSDDESDRPEPSESDREPEHSSHSSAHNRVHSPELSENSPQLFGQNAASPEHSPETSINNAELSMQNSESSIAISELSAVASEFSETMSIEGSGHLNATIKPTGAKPKSPVPKPPPSNGGSSDPATREESPTASASVSPTSASASPTSASASIPSASASATSASSSNETDTSLEGPLDRESDRESDQQLAMANNLDEHEEEDVEDSMSSSASSAMSWETPESSIAGSISIDINDIPVSLTDRTTTIL